ncbi:Glutamate-rich protein 3 [Geodia barretti]|uniref:Glutamate-rich protein 3 n=1 Tax=Geodia barretti TaxID=519541 RepID=A0AA35SVC1_GEOBA|nr:Glutamate-rich protein 3 [Geodia barretti]
MQNSPPSILSYNSLLDEHLAEYYSSPQRKRHLRRMGLITRGGRLVDERTFQRRATQREYRMRYKDDVATNTAVALSEKQRQQKAELKKKLEALAKYETVQRIKSLLGLGKATLSNKTVPTLNSLSDTCLSGAIEKHKERVSFTPDELGELKHLVKTIAGPRVAGPTIVQAKAGYCPLSTTTPRASAASKKEPGRRRPSTAPTKPPQPKTAGKATEKLVQEKDSVTMTLGYLGTTKALKSKKPLTDVEVWQQAQGFTPVRVFKDLIRPGAYAANTDIAQRTRLGGRSAHFKVSSIKGGSPCHLCQKAKEERKSRKKAQESKQEAQSTPQLSATLQSTQLESLLTQSGEEDEREGVISRSPSLSRYSSSFSSESSQDSGGEGGERRESVDSPYLLSESKRSAVLNETQRGDVDESLNNGVDTSTDPVLDAEETNSAKQDGGQDATTAEARPELVTRGGVRIVYKLGPVPTSEHGTQTNNEVPANEPECGTQTNAKAPETGAQVEEQPTADATERGTQNDEQATPETGDQTTADTPALGTQTDEQPLESAAAPEHGKLTDQQTTPGTESLVVDSNPAHTTLASTDEREEKEDRQMKEEDKEPEQKYDEQKANPDPSTINESVVGSTQSSQLPVSEIQLGKDMSQHHRPIKKVLVPPSLHHLTLPLKQLTLIAMTLWSQTEQVKAWNHTPLSRLKLSKLQERVELCKPHKTDAVEEKLHIELEYFFKSDGVMIITYHPITGLHLPVASKPDQGCG